MFHRIALTALLSAVVLTGCSQAESTPGEPTAGSNRPTAEPTAGNATDTTAPSPTPTPTTAIGAFGRTAEYPDGLSMTVAAPEPFKPSNSAAGTTPGGNYLLFTVTLVNGTPEPYDPVLFNATVQSDNVEAQQVYDSAKNILGNPSTSVLPGRETTFKLVFNVTNPADLVLEASPGFEYKPSIFTSTGS